MNLRELTERLTFTVVQGSLDLEISHLTYDTRLAGEKDLFVCIAGANYDAHEAVAEVAERGAAAFVVERDVCAPEGVTVLKVEDTREALAILSAAWFGYPAERLTTIGVTGTKGKTTTTHMIRAILEKAGHKTGLIGTNGVVYGDCQIQTKNTTPESYQVQEYFRMMADAGCEYVVMEASSQGIMLHRLSGFFYDYGVFTNIAPDHIGPNEHKDFDEYLYYKSRILSMCRNGLGNADDAHWDRVEAGHTCTLSTFAVDKDADYKAEEIQYHAQGNFMGVRFCVSGKRHFQVDVGIPGLFNVYNALAAIAVTSEIGVSEEAIKAGLKDIHVTGRMEIVYASDKFSVIVDYAHNEVSMESLLLTLRDYQPKRLVCLFGCGGNRSKLRRYGMGEIGGRLADLSIITEDNSRFEDVKDIIADIRIGMDKTDGKFLEIPDRREAIFYAIGHAEPGDMIVIIGKGHEDYQEIKGVRYPFLDSAVAKEALRKEGLC